jgi:hypothetical protein
VRDLAHFGSTRPGRSPVALPPNHTAVPFTNTVAIPVDSSLGKRRQGKRNSVRERRVSLTAAERRHVLAKTSGRCHICGGKVEADAWQADHVMAVQRGDQSSGVRDHPNLSILRRNTD